LGGEELNQIKTYKNRNHNKSAENVFMKNMLALLLLIGFSSFAQDTLIWKNHSRTIVTITDMYEDTLYYTNTTDKKPYHCHLSNLNSIFYKDGSKRHFEGIYSDSNSENLNLTASSIVTLERDTALYNKGIKDAIKHFTYGEYMTMPWRKNPFYTMASENQLPWPNSLFKEFAPMSELDLIFPDKELELKSDYRAGFVYQCKILRKKHQRKTAVILLIAATLVTATLVL